MRNIPYDRSAAVAYARAWALGRNPAYYDFEKIGGDCTNFASQCIFAGARTMNFTPVTGWYYRTSSARTASWCGVAYLYKFLMSNRGPGPYARLVAQRQAAPGDIVQLGRWNGVFYHTSVILSADPVILVAAHSDDSLDRPLSSYNYDVARFVHIDGVRAE